jgi:hypothetical protein
MACGPEQTGQVRDLARARRNEPREVVLLVPPPALEDADVEAGLNEPAGRDCTAEAGANHDCIELWRHASPRTDHSQSQREINDPIASMAIAPSP